MVAAILFKNDTTAIKNPRHMKKKCFYYLFAETY